MTKIKEKGLHLDGIVSLFQKNKAIQSPIDILERNGLNFKAEYTYGMLSYSTQEFYEKNQRHLPRTRFNNKFSKQEANLITIQDQVRNILPVLYKAKSIVVAGDEHQMPPSNFFSKQLELDENEEEDDMEELIEVESLLEFCQNSTQFKSRYLDFHYRSNHEGLINFSNDAIYKRLVVKPTKEWDYAPFMLSKVHNGKWVNQRNELEAGRII